MSKVEQKSETIRPVFVEMIPADSKELKAGVLYISMKYNTLVHRCPCGCGGLSEIGLHPATRSMVYNGENISIEPSIGVRTLRCRSHYWITENRIVWADPLSEELDEWFDGSRRDLTKDYAEAPAVRQTGVDRRGWWAQFLRSVKKWLR